MMRFRVALGAFAWAGLALATASAMAADGAQTAAKPKEPFTVKAIINEGAEEIPNKVSFTLHRLDSNGGGDLEAESAGGIAEFDVPPGEYLLTTAYGAALKQELVRVRGGPTGEPHTVVLNAGEITLRIIPGVGQPALDHPIEWQIQTLNRNAEGKRHLLRRADGSNPHLVLPAGWYFVSADFGDGEITHTIEVGAGTRFDYTLVQQN